MQQLFSATALAFGLAISAHAQSQVQAPPVGSTVRLGDNPDKGDWSLSLLKQLHPRPVTGTETVAERHANTRAIAQVAEGACLFRRPQSEIETGGQWPYQFTVEGTQDVAQQRRFVNGQTQSENHRWVRVSNRFRPACTGWWDLGVVQAVPTAAAATPPTATTAAKPVAAQTPGSACPTGWQANPGGGQQRGGGFKCFADSTSTIPAGWQCPDGLVLKDHSATGMLLCQPR